MAKIAKIKDFPNYLPIDQKLVNWGWETIDIIRKNFKVKKIFPEGEIYPGWFAENEKRQGTNSWYSTGEGFDSLYFQLLNVSEMDIFRLKTLDMIFRYRKYLDFVDLGVGKGRKAGDVQRSRAAEHDKQYFNMWNPKTGDTHRPAISPEIRHQVRRLSRYLGYRYVDEIDMKILTTFENLELEITL